MRKTNEIHDKIAVYEDFFKFLSEKTGLTLQELDSSKVLDLYNLLTAQVSRIFKKFLFMHIIKNILKYNKIQTFNQVISFKLKIKII